MKFSDYKYERPNMDEFKQSFLKKINQFDEAESLTQQIDAINAINQMRNYFSTMATLVSIRQSIDTLDEFYDAEMAFFDEITPDVESLTNQFYKKLDQSKNRDELKDKLGTHFFNLIEVNLKSFDPCILEDLRLENSLMTKYMKLRASSKIMFDGEEKNLAQMTPYLESKERETRKNASRLISNFFEKNEEEFDKIYDELVKVRHQMAKKLGFENYVPLGYMRLGRTDYNAEMVEGYRNQVHTDLVPIATALKQRQKERLGLDELMSYDETFAFNSGNATPKGDQAWILENGKKMYEALSNESGEFFNYMLDKELMDLEAKKGKSGGGYCTFIPDYKSPFIFSNFNGTSGDIDVLTHEAGHAFQVFQSRNYEIPEYVWPTLEACEIHSMSMEFITYPWMQSFFKEDTEKYKFSHLSGAILFIPYGTLVDEFQHFVYENPFISPDARKQKWHELEVKYLPHTNYGDDDFLNRGGFWFRQGHIFTDPFYYIDYTLAQVCAFQFYEKFKTDRVSAWEDYLNLCKQGGSRSFLELVEIAKLENPFKAGSIKKIIPNLLEDLENIDDKSL